MRKPHVVEAIIGNTKVLGQLDSNGILQRFYYPAVDYYQQIKLFLAAVFLDGLIFFQREDFKKASGYKDDFAYCFEYEIGSRRIFQLDFVDFQTDSLIRKWDCNFEDFYVFFEPMINEYTNFNAAFVDRENQIIYTYYRGSFIALGFENRIVSFTVSNGIDDAKDNLLEGVERIANPQIAVKLENKGSVVVFVAFGGSKEEVKNKILLLKNKGFSEIYEQNKVFWQRKFARLEFITTQDERDLELQKRSAQVFYLLQNSKTGGILAAPEVDERFYHCGGYGFVWGRDAAFITRAMDGLGMKEEVEKFFEFKFGCQEEGGYWDQRYYTDGNLAPSWGVQIDETASVVWGFLEHCEKQNSLHLVDLYRDKLQKALRFLLNATDDRLGVVLKSFDLWEEREGIHLYSNASIYAALKKASKYFPELESEIEKKLKAIKNQTATTFYSPRLLRYVRSADVRISKKEFLKLPEENRYIQKDEKYEVTYYFKKQDEVADISILGVYYPFEMIDSSDEALKGAIFAIERECENRIVGGYKRYSDDRYIDGNPWILTTLWLAIYYKKTGKVGKAEELFEWAKAHSLPNGLFPEQVDKVTGQPAWVVPLAWSHAMYVLYLYE
ncbi:glycoside hydrolase family 15 protein [Caldicellulosiruptor morganii]|uniref:Glycoside hydrolase family 15 n=1 Tax=Caldicellulosiruptor morganii TaxID=1387555 RepID=A0ABY7BS13_9FIRM|nr:glycoside hydrolase family 15 protein [Caldicellulosiruptor morganii]WAM33946.1 glycoside hydrolase family 15 [Caldicellulosiruptor morganii]